MDDAYRPVLRHLETLYGSETAAALLPRVSERMTAAGIATQPAQPWSERDALCITYGNSIRDEGDVPLRALHKFFRRHVGEGIPILHLLPFFPYSSDDGFSIIDYDQVRPNLGTWDDVARLAADYRLVFDWVVNHVSERSVYMQQYAAGNPDFAGFFIEASPDADLANVTRPRTLPLLHDYETAEGMRWLWTTFSRDQVDLNFRNPAVLLETIRVMLAYVARGASLLRLDAIPYVWKEPGTTCIHLPQAHAMVKLFRAILDIVAPHVRLLSETNVPHEENLAYFGDRMDEAHMIYNFTLAPLILWSIFKGDASTLTQWAAKLEWVAEHATYLNITATHDGIGVRPTEGILSEAERQELVRHVYEHGGLMSSRRRSDGVDLPYELNISYFDALTHPDSTEPVARQVARFLVSQAIPMALLGVPGIYIHSLLGSRNDRANVERTGRARSINRAQLNLADLERELSDPDSRRRRVLDGIKHMLRVRAGCPAFSPRAPQTVRHLAAGVFAVERRHPTTGDRVLALHNVSERRIDVDFADIVPCPGRDLIADTPVTEASLTLAPYQVCWIHCR